MKRIPLFILLLSTLFLSAQTAKVVRGSRSMAVNGGSRSMAVTGGSTHQVSLAWSDSTSGVTYNIYRGVAQGGESLYATGQPSASYTDTNVVSGTTYWYYVTAVLNGDESAGSNEISAAVPNNPPAPSGLTVTGVK